jgi:hypothetical protein
MVFKFECYIFFNVLKLSLKLYLFTPWRYIRTVEVKLHSLLTSELDGGEWSASLPGRSVPVVRSPSKF